MALTHADIRELSNKERWKRRHYDTVALARAVLGLAQDLGGDELPGPLRLAYRDSYIAVRVMRKTFKFRVCQFVLFQRSPAGPDCTFRIRRCREVDQWLGETQLQYVYENKGEGGYRVQLTAGDVRRHTEIIKKLAQRAYDEHPFAMEPMWRRMIRFEVQ